MSSIRSLATITLLAGVGIFLYLKINEADPVLPAEVEGLQLDAIQFGQQPPASSAVPHFGTTSPGDAAPAFNPTATAEQAPAWNDSQTSSAASALASPPLDPHVNEAPVFGDSSEANLSAASAPDLPPLPTLPQSTGSGELPATAQNLNAPPAFDAHAMQSPHEHTHSPEALQAPSTTPAADMTAQGQSSLFSATRLAVEASLDRGELSQALLLLSDWYDDPSLSGDELQEVNNLLRQLAGSVIYSTEHRLEPPYMVQAGEQLVDIAQKYQVPWQLLAKINGISLTDQLQPGQQLKVIRGPFSALIDLGRRKMTLMLDRRYAGQFSLEADPSITVEEGLWAVNQKLLTPGSAGSIGSPSGATEERSLMLSRSDGSTGQLTILRGTNAVAPSEPAGRVLRLGPQEVEDVYDILSVGSRVVIRR